MQTRGQDTTGVAEKQQLIGKELSGYFVAGVAVDGRTGHRWD